MRDMSRANRTQNAGENRQRTPGPDGFDGRAGREGARRERTCSPGVGLEDIDVVSCCISSVAQATPNAAAASRQLPRGGGANRTVRAGHGRGVRNMGEGRVSTE